MTLTELVDRIQEQLRLTPISSETDIIRWLQQAIRRFGIRSAWLDAFTVIPVKSGAARYLLPADHVATTAVYYNGNKLQKCTVSDAELVSPSGPVYYHEDDWQDEASEAQAGEFALHWGLNEFWLLQLMRSQLSLGRKTLTLVAAPTVDGSAVSEPLVGGMDGTTTSETFWTAVSPGGAYTTLDTSGNLALFYKRFDALPQSVTDDLSWKDIPAILYGCGALSMALSTEDDECDRYRSWLYSYIGDSVSQSLRGMAINRRLH